MVTKQAVHAVGQAEGQNGPDPAAAAFAQLWNSIKAKNPLLQKNDLPAPGREVDAQTRGGQLKADKGKIAHMWLLEQQTDIRNAGHFDAASALLPGQSMGQHNPSLRPIIAQQQMRTGNAALPPVSEMQQARSVGSFESSAHATLAAPSNVNALQSLPPSFALQLNAEDLALAEACLDGLAEEEEKGRSLRFQCVAAAKAVQRLGVDSTDEGVRLLLMLLGPLGLGGDNITPAQMKALLEALGESARELEGARPESLRLRLREHLLGEQPPSPQQQQHTERSSPWPRGSRQPPSGGSPVYGHPWDTSRDTSRHQASPQKRSGVRNVMMASSASMSPMPNCDALAKTSSRTGSQRSFHNYRSPEKQPVILPAIDSVVSCKSLQCLSSSPLVAKASLGARSSKHARPAKARYGDRRLPPVFMEVNLGHPLLMK